MLDRHGDGHRRREDVAGLKDVVAWESEPSIAENRSVPEVPKVPRFDLDARNVGDAWALLRTVPTASIKLSSWGPQYRQRLTKLAYGNEGMNRGQRRKQLPAMSPAYIASCDAEIGRIMAPPGYCCRWVDVTSCSCHVRGGTTVGSARLNCWPTLQTRREASASLPARVAHRTRPARSRAFPPTGPPKRKNARTARCGRMHKTCQKQRYYVMNNPILQAVDPNTSLKDEPTPATPTPAAQQPPDFVSDTTPDPAPAANSSTKPTNGAGKDANPPPPRSPEPEPEPALLTPEEMAKLDAEEKLLSEMRTDLPGRAGVPDGVVAITVAHKLPKDTFFRVNKPNTIAMRMYAKTTGLDTEYYAIHPCMWTAFASIDVPLSTFRLYEILTVDGAHFVHPVRQPDHGDSQNEYPRTKEIALEQATTKWVRISTDKANKKYRVFKASKDRYPDPLFPDYTPARLLTLCFADRGLLVDSPKHDLFLDLAGGRSAD